MQNNDNRNNRTSNQKRKTGQRAVGSVRNTAAKRPAPARTRPKTVSGDPMSRDEVRSAKIRERKKKRRRMQLLIYAVATVLVITAAVIISLTVFFKISAISVTGDEVYSSAQIIEASKLKKGENLFSFSKTDVTESIETKLPYVENVEIKRSPSGKVTLKIGAAKAMLAVDRGDSYILLSSGCKILEDNIQALNEDAITLKASELTDYTPGTTAQFKNPSDLQTVSDIVKLIGDGKIENISEIDITDPEDIKLGYSQRIVLKVGTVSNFEKNIDFIKATLAKNDTDEPNFSGVIDFTIENKAFINDATEPVTAKPPQDGKNDGEKDGKNEENSANKNGEITEKQTQTAANDENKNDNGG